MWREVSLGSSPTAHSFLYISSGLHAAVQLHGLYMRIIKKFPKRIYFLHALAPGVRFAKILKALKYKYVLRIIYSSTHSGLVKLWF